MKASIIGAVMMVVIIGALYFVTKKPEALPVPGADSQPAAEQPASSDSNSSSNFKL